MAEHHVLLGTSKGAFILTSGADRMGWRVSGPHCDGWPIGHVLGDPATGRIWAAGGSDWHGVGVWRSDDLGATWTLSQEGLQDQGLVAFWSMGLAGGTLYAGTKPAGLMASHDGGVTWARVTGIADPTEIGDWLAGAAGLVLHTIVSDPADPARLWVGISAEGVFASEDGGATWERRNRLSNESAALRGADETWGCVHHMVRAPGTTDLMYQQNHNGVHRSRDGGRTWDYIGAGLPSDFGFPLAVHPHDPAMIWALPLNGDSAGRFPPGAAAAVWRSADGGASWAAMRDGLPQANCYFTVLRQAMATDREPAAGVYFGTNTGSVFASRDDGATWSEIARHLPLVQSVETMTL